MHSKVVALISCSILQASSAAISFGTPILSKSFERNVLLQKNLAAAAVAAQDVVVESVKSKGLVMFI